jgi:hypothetical protein
MNLILLAIAGLLIGWFGMTLAIRLTEPKE